MPIPELKPLVKVPEAVEAERSVTGLTKVMPGPKIEFARRSASTDAVVTMACAVVPVRAKEPASQRERMERKKRRNGGRFFNVRV